MATVFISHSSKDNNYAVRVRTWLKDRGIGAVFLDIDPETGLVGGREWERELYLQIRAADVLIAIETNNFLTSPWCLIEVAQAKALNKAIISVTHGPLPEDTEHIDATATQLKKTIRDLIDRFQRVDVLDDWGRLDSALKDVGLDAHWSRHWDGTHSPWPGLAAYNEYYAPVFCGRDNEIVEAMGVLEAGRSKSCPRLVLVTGASGAGKSSLVCAGIVPRLDPKKWVTLGPLRPGRFAPTHHLARYIARHPEFGIDATRLRELMLDESDEAFQELIKRIAQLVNKADADSAVLLVIDQLEEVLVTESEGEPDRRAFHSILRRLVTTPGLPLVILATMRSDVLEAFQGHPTWIDLPREYRQEFTLWPMPPERFSKIIESPARHGHVEFESGLVAQIVTEARSRNALPMLSFALNRLYSCSNDGILRSSSWIHEVGGIKGAITYAVRTAVGGTLTPEKEAALRSVFVRYLVGFDRRGPYLRRQVKLSDLPQESQSLVEKFAEARLLTIDDRGEGRTVEVVHESLFESWDDLSKWLAEGRQLLQFCDDIDDQLKDWKVAGKKQHPSHLLSGPQLVKARRFLKDAPDQLKVDEQAYFNASIAADVRRTRLENASVVFGLLLVIGLIGVGGFAYLNERNRATEERNHRLTRLAKTRLLQEAALDRERRRDYGTSAVLLSHALLEADGQDPELESSLRSAISLSQGQLVPLQTILSAPGTLRGCALSPDGALVAFGTNNIELNGSRYAGVLFVDVKSGVFHKPPAFGRTFYTTGLDWEKNDNVTDVTFDPHGRKMAVSTDGFKVHIVDLETGRAEILSHAGRPMTVRFSSDGRSLLVAGWRDKGRHANPMPLVLYDVATKQVIRDFDVGYDLYAATISEDGRWIAAGGGMPPDPRLQIWDLHDAGSRPQEIPQHARVFALAFRPGAAGELATGDLNGTVRFWRRSGSSTQWQASEPAITYEKPVRVVAYSEDGRLLLAGGEDSSARLWDSFARTPVGQRLEHLGQVRGGAVSSKSGRLVTGGFAGDIRVFTIPSGTATGVALRHTGPVRDAVFNSDGTKVLAGFDSSPLGPGGGRVWDVSGERSVDLPHGADVLRILSRPKVADRAVTFANDGSVVYWDARTGLRLDEWKSPDRSLINSAAMRMNGSSVAFAETRKGVVHVVDFARDVFGVRHELSYRGAAFIWNLHFLGDGRLASDGGNAIRVWDPGASRRRPLTPIEQCEPQKADMYLGAISPDEKSVMAHGLDGRIVIWRIGQLRGGGVEIGKRPHGSGQVCTDWSVRDVIATGGPDGVVRLWESNGIQRGVDLIHPSPLETVVFSPEGDWLATGGRDGGVRLWKVASGVWSGVGWHHENPVTRIRFSPDGRLVLSASRDGTVRIVPIPPETTGEPEDILSRMQAEAGIAVQVKGTGAAAAATAPRALGQDEHRKLRIATP